MPEINLLAVAACTFKLKHRDLPAHLKSLLPNAELIRANEMKDETSKAEFILGRALLRSVISSLLNSAPRQLPILIERNGRPYLEGHDLEFSLSHACGYVCVAASRNSKVGVDIEGVGLLESSGVLNKFLRKTFLDDEAPSLTSADYDIAGHWCMCEAYAKCSGQDMLTSMRSEELRRLMRQPRRSNWHVGSEHSICLTSIANGRIPLALCVDALPMPFSVLEIDLFDELFLSKLQKKMRHIRIH